VLRAAGLRVHGITVTAEGSVPGAGEPTVFCRPVVTAPAITRRDGTVLADSWLPDLVRNKARAFSVRSATAVPTAFFLMATGCHL